MKLYDYFRSSASYRVRIALAWKGLTYEKVSVHLIKNGGEQRLPGYLAINPQGLVPTLEVETPEKTRYYLSQSLAIIEYLEEIQPSPPLLPEGALAKAMVRSIALTIACDIHPLNNLRTLTYLKKQFPLGEEEAEDQRQSWYYYWLQQGFDTLERRLEERQSTNFFCYGDSVTLADICLIPQVYNAQRFGFSLTPYSRLSAINAHCLTLKAFKEAAPGLE